MDQIEDAYSLGASSVAESNARGSRRGKMAPPAAILPGRRPKAHSRSTLRSEDEMETIAKIATNENDENALVPQSNAPKAKIFKSLLEFDTEVEHRCKQIETEGQLASHALNQVLAIWKMQLPPYLRNMSLADLHGRYKGDISAALSSATETKVTPLMTPLSIRRSVRKSTKLPSQTPRIVSKSLHQSFEQAQGDGTTITVDGIAFSSESANKPSFDPTKLNLLSNSVLNDVMSQSDITDSQKLEVLAALKRQIAMIEDNLPSARPSRK